MIGKIGRTSIIDNRFIARLIELGLDRDNFVLFGSAPLLTHGLREDIHDLDVVTRGHTWRHVSARGIPAVGAVSGDPVTQFWGGRIQFSQGWISPAWDPDVLIDGAEVIEGLRFARLTDVLAYKQVLRRPKDIVDIQRILTMVEGTVALSDRPTQVGFSCPPRSTQQASDAEVYHGSPRDLRRLLCYPGPWRGHPSP